MENFLSSFMQLKSSDDKYDCLYLNTPWHKLSVEQLGKLDVSSLTKDDALLYMWGDTYSMSDSMDLARKYGFKFDSIYQISDFSSYPKTTPLKDLKSENKDKKVTESSSVDVSDETKVEPMSVDGSVESKVVEDSVESKTKTVTKRVKKSRCPPLSLPSYLKNSEMGSSRPMCEVLLLFYKGDRNILKSLSNEKAGSIAYQVSAHPELGKKSRSVPKKNIYLDAELVCDRPAEFLETVLNHLSPNAKVLELFGSSVRNKVDSCGPNIPGGFSTSYNSLSGISGTFNKILRTMRKVQLQSLLSALVKIGQTDDRDVKVKEFASVKDLWEPLVSSLSDLKSKVSYDWGSEEIDLPAEWLRLAVIFFTQKNIADFGSLRRRKKKRKTSANGKPACHGIAKPMIVSKELTEFLGLKEGDKISRTHSVKLINDYVKEHGLQNPERKIEIIPDEKLAKILNPPENFGPVTYFKMCGLIGPHFPKTEKKLAEESKRKLEEEDSMNEEVGQGSPKKQKVDS